jgi:hypothetical protein
MVHKFRVYSQYGGTAGVAMSNLGSHASIGVSDSYVDNAWHHIVIIINPVTDKLWRYIDGDVDVAGSDITNTNAHTGALTLGYQTDDGEGYSYDSTAFLDSFSYWTRAFSATEVTEIYNSGKLFDLKEHSAFGDLKLWWKMGGDLVDHSGNGYTGVKVGTGVNASTEAPPWDSSHRLKQLPFSKRFQVIRALDGNQVTKD